MDWRVLYDPFTALGNGRGLAMAVLAVVVLGAVARWGGVHVGEALVPKADPSPFPVRTVLIDSLVGWISLAVLLFVASRVMRGGGGFGAYLAVSGLSRFPYMIAVIILSRPVLGDAMMKAMYPPGEGVIIRPDQIITPGLAVGMLAVCAMMAWTIVVLYHGFKASSRLPGNKAVLGFLIGAVAAQLLGWLLLRGI